MLVAKPGLEKADEEAMVGWAAWAANQATGETLPMCGSSDRNPRFPEPGTSACRRKGERPARLGRAVRRAFLGVALEAGISASAAPKGQARKEMVRILYRRHGGQGPYP